MESPPILDPGPLARLVSLIGAATVRRLIETFVELAPARRAALVRAAEAGELTPLANAAHAVVAGAGQLGAARLAERMRALEEAARRGDRDAALPLVAGALAEFDAALDALTHTKEPG
ncbi:MAG TPA: Hpt domain-containing protein [Gemmatimonadales bacterium]|nr:Hpt domain-containing protein [Gemmatimonadales bacterium]